MNIDVVDDTGHAVGRKQPIDQGLQPVGLLDNHAGVFVQFGVGQFALQQLRCAANPAERVFNLMGQVAHQFAAHLSRLQKPIFPIGTQALINFAQLEQNALEWCIKRRGNGLKLKAIAGIAPQCGAIFQFTAEPLQAKILMPHPKAAFTQIDQQCVNRRAIDKNSRERLPRNRSHRNAQQLFSNRIEVPDTPVAIEDDHRTGQ